MATVKPNWYYRVDSQGLPVRGGAIEQRRSRPTGGKWRRLIIPECCTTFAEEFVGNTTDLEDLDSATLTDAQWRTIAALALSKIPGYY